MSTLKLTKRYLASAAILIVLLLLSLLLLPLTYALLAVVVLISAFILLDASHHKVLFKMAQRNFIRRKSTTALVIGGLMVGTAIIAASFVVGDTLDNMIVNEVTKGAGDVDFVVASINDQGGYDFYNQTFSDNLTAQLEGIPNVVAVSPLVMDSYSIQNVGNGLSTPNIMATGINQSLWTSFGGFQGTNGTFYAGPSPTGCYLFTGTAKDLGANIGDTVIIAQGTTFLPLTVEALVENHEPGQTGLNSEVWVDINTIQTGFNHTGETNTWFIHNSALNGDNFGANDQVRDDINAILAPLEPSTGLEIVFDVKQILVEGQAQLEVFTQLFLVFGSFSVIAGIALVINIFTMLGEERKSEMGMARALGMQRTDLRRLLTYEGLLYGVAASAVGALFGLAIAYGLVYFVDTAFQFASVPLTTYFTFTGFSLTISFLAGFIITIATVYITTRRISNLNIVRAIRNIPEPPVERKNRRTLLLGIAGLAIGLLMILVGISLKNAGPAYAGLSTMVLSSGFLLRRIMSDRLAWSIAGLATLILWLPLPEQITPFNDYESGIEMFIISGLFMVASSLILVIFNSSSIVWFMTKLFRTRGSYRAVAVTAVSYPLRARFRTGLSIFIFGLVIFTVTVLTMLSGLIGAGVTTMVEESSGGFDVIAFKSLPVPMPNDPWQYINESGGPLQAGNVSNMISLPAMPATANYTGVTSSGATSLADRGTSVIGFDQRFFTEGSFPLSQYNSSLYGSSDEVYRAVLSDPGLVIVDGSFAVMDGGGFGGQPGVAESPGVTLGQTIRLESVFGTFQNVTVVGVMKQQFLSGVYMATDVVTTAYGAEGPSIMLIDFSTGLDVAEQAALLEVEFLPWGVITINVDQLAQEITGAINSIFTLFRAFLAIGLIIGIVGLGIITIRSINERKLEIGMMRAIGFRKRMVVVNFAIESAFVSALGIMIGTVMGYIVGYNLWKTSFSGSDFAFVVDWWPIIFVGLAAFIATILCVYPAARGASKVSPAEVLRFD